MEDCGKALKNLDHPDGANCGDSLRLVQLIDFLFEAPDYPRPQWLAFNCGLHDIKTDPASFQRQVELPEYKKNLAAIVAAARGRSIKVVWIATTPVDNVLHRRYCGEFLRFEEDVQAYNLTAASLMGSYQVPVVDLHSFTSSLTGERYIDHVHFNDETRRLQAAFLAGHFEQLIME